jgi:hypothetical protein
VRCDDLLASSALLVLTHCYVCPNRPRVQMSEVESKSGETLLQLRTKMEASLQLPDVWVFLLKGAPVGKKAEGKRVVDDLGEIIIIRDKAGKPAPKSDAGAASSGSDRGIVPVALEGGSALGSVAVESSATLEVARRTIREKLSGFLPAEFVFLRNHAPVGMKQEKKLTVADCLPVLLLRDKASRRASAPPTPTPARAQAAQPAVAVDAAMVAVVSTCFSVAMASTRPL